MFIKRKARETNLARHLFLVVGKPLLDDEQIESHAESYIAPKKCAVEVYPLGTLRELIIQPTRDTFSAKPLTSILNFLRSE